ncbi:NADH-quinone oxidoreductase subunit J [candidate division KSB1 bacterium]|nr:MAG: NADH-quinone oxidoreductase subunit J [candidate division KSB1 bacterium]
MTLLSQIVFWFFVALTVVSAAVVVFHKRIIYSAFALLFAFFGVAVLYLFLHADFLAAAQVLIYVGGILTLVIFGVFLTAKITTLDIPQLTHQRFLALIPLVLLGLGIFLVFYTVPWPSVQPEITPTTQRIGELLLTRYLVPFELASVLLLAALVGAMRLARHFRQQEGD